MSLTLPRLRKECVLKEVTQRLKREEKNNELMVKLLRSLRDRGTTRMPHPIL